MSVDKVDTKEARIVCNENYNYFTEHFDELFAQYPERFVVLKEQTVIGDYNTFDEAYQETIKTEKLGTFLIQQCTMDESLYTAYFANNNVAFVG